jgi:hypothetical protein
MTNSSNKQIAYFSMEIALDPAMSTHSNALYERHLTFDQVIPPPALCLESQFLPAYKTGSHA